MSYTLYARFVRPSVRQYVYSDECWYLDINSIIQLVNNENEWLSKYESL